MVFVRRRIMLDADLAKRRIRCASSWPPHQPRLWIYVAINLKQIEIRIVKGTLKSVRCDEVTGCYTTRD